MNGDDGEKEDFVIQDPTVDVPKERKVWTVVISLWVALSFLFLDFQGRMIQVTD